MKTLKLLVLSTVLIFGVTAVTLAQDEKAIIDAYNNGVKLINSDTKSAIASFEKCVSLAEDTEELSEKGEQTKKLAEDQIPKLYYKLAVDSYKKHDFEGAIKYFEQTEKAGKKYGNQALAQKSHRLIPKLYYAWGKQEFIQKNYQDALNIFDKGIATEPNLASAYLGKALVYDKLKQEDKMTEAANKAIDIAQKVHDQKTLVNAQKFMRNYTYNHAVMAIQNNKQADAEKYLNASIKYGNNSPDVYYELGKIQRKKGKYTEALNYLQKALSLDQGNEVTKAKYYFALGKVYEDMNKKTEACAAFRKALHPPYDESAKYEMEQVLKCK